MGLATIDPHCQKEHTEIHKISKFQLVLIRLVLTEIQPFENVKIYKEMYGHPDTVSDSVRMPYISLLILTFLNLCISVKTTLINAKLGNLVNLGVLFLTMGINSR